MSKNPYNTLDVEVDSTDADIKQAYRDKSKETHPDKGGSNEEFQEVNKAYVILSDPEKRKQFDETGKVDEDNTEDNIYNDIAGLFYEFLESYQGDFESADIIKLMTGGIGEIIGHNKKELIAVDDKIEKIKKFKNRITKKSKETANNIFDDIIEGKLNALEKSKLPIDNLITKYKQIKEIFSEYECSVKERATPPDIFLDSESLIEQLRAQHPFGFR